MSKASSRVIRPTEMAEMMGCTADAIRKRVRSGVIPSPPPVPGRKPFWNRRDIEAWFEAGCPTAEQWTYIKAQLHRGSAVNTYLNRMEADSVRAETKQRLRVQTA